MKSMKVIITLAMTSAAAWGAFGEVVSSFPMPVFSGFDCSGLTWDGSYLWALGNPNTYFYRLSTTGSVVYSFDTGGTYGYNEGAAFDGVYLWSASLQYGYPIRLNRWTLTGTPVAGYSIPDAWTGTAGLTWDGHYLWCQNCKYTTAGSFVASFVVPFSLSDLGWDGHYLWSSSRQLTTTGSFVASFPAPGTGGYHPGCTTFDGSYLRVVNRLNDWCYQVDIGVVDVAPASLGDVKALYR